MATGFDTHSCPVAESSMEIVQNPRNGYSRGLIRELAELDNTEIKNRLLRVLMGSVHFLTNS